MMSRRRNRCRIFRVPGDGANCSHSCGELRLSGDLREEEQTAVVAGWGWVALHCDP
jgi:hypothetical protein